MTGGVLLAAYAVAAGFGAPAALRRDWVRGTPGIAIALWLVLAASWLAAASLAALTVAGPLSLTWRASAGQGPGVLRGAAGETLAVLAGVLLGAGIAGRACWQLGRGLAAARRGHRAHAAALAASGRPDPALGVIITSDETPAAYCVPSGRHRVAVSAGALARLTPAQLQAVLAHERAHLRGHHHLTMAAAAALARAFPVVPLFAGIAAEVTVLVEMAADDAAARHHAPADLAAALVALAGAAAGSTALAAGGPAAIARIHRLLTSPPPPRLPARTARTAAYAAAFVVPAAVACLPLAVAACGIMTAA